MFFKCFMLLFVLSFVQTQVSCDAYPRVRTGLKYGRAKLFPRKSIYQFSRPNRYNIDGSYPQTCAMPRLKHGRARWRPRGSFVKFSCVARYTLIGNKYATCRNGEWDVPLPVCVRTGCSPLKEVKNGLMLTSHNNSWVVFFCFPGHELVGSPVVYCDGSQWNSTAPECIDSSVKLSTSCDFETPGICGWKSDEIHDFDWRRWNHKTPSSFLQTGPTYDHTHGENGTGYYMYIETTGRVENDTARLISPVYNASLAQNGCFIFYYHMFGRSMGGLRVYQKPDSVPMLSMLSGPLRQNYTLFEQWGDQGNEWYGSVSMLSDVGEDFQIVIEGIRGVSFMSDIAIDDVSIQQGDNCTDAMATIVTPPPVLLESCVGRCDIYSERAHYRGCSCSIICLVNQNCCPDFLDVCDIDPNRNQTSDDDDTSTSRTISSVALPQTQKLVATTTETLPPTTTRSSTTRVSTTTTTSTTSTTTTTTRRPATAKRFTTTTPVPITLKTITTTKKPRTTTPTTTSTTAPKPSTPKRTTPSTTTHAWNTTITLKVTPIASSTILFIKTTKHVEIIDKKVKKTEKGIQGKIVAEKAGGMSSATIAVTVLLVGALCCGALWVALVLSRSSRGSAALARIRGRVTADPEVRYLTNAEDDD